MANNLKIASKTKSKAREATFYLTRMKEESGRSFQSLLADIVIRFVRSEAKTDPEKQAIVKEYSEALTNE